MSLDTWKKEFYPIEANEPDVIDTDFHAVSHALQKWTGLLPENLNKHDVYLDGMGKVREHGIKGRSLPIDFDTCSLCLKNNTCYTCVLFKHLGNHRFDVRDLSPYVIFALDKNPVPMICDLREILDELTEC